MFDVAIWGTVGQWVSGLASSGALIAALYVILRDRRLRTSEQARRVVPWVDHPDSGDIFTVINYSDAPILNVELIFLLLPSDELEGAGGADGREFDLTASIFRIVFESDAAQEKIDLLSTIQMKGDGAVGSLLPLESVTATASVPATPYRTAFLSFTDLSGHRWVRRVGGELLSSRQANKLNETLESRRLISALMRNSRKREGELKETLLKAYPELLWHKQDIGEE